MTAPMRVLASFLIGPMLTATPLLAQSPGFALELRAGYAGSTTELGRTAVLEQQGYVTFGQRDPGGFVGAAGIVQVTDLLGFRVSFDYAPDTDVQGFWQCAPLIPCPDVLIEPEARLRRWTLGADVRISPSIDLGPFGPVIFVPEARLRRWTLGADVRISPPIDLGPLRPVIFVGAGTRKQELRWSSPLAQVPFPVAFDETDGFVRGGLGLSGAINRLELFGEADGTVGPFGSPEQQYIEGLIPDGRNTNFDLGITMGARVRIR